MKKLSLGEWNTKLIYPLLMGFCSFITLLSNKTLRIVKTSGGKLFYQKPFLVAWVMTLSEVCAIFFFKIQRERTRKFEKTERTSEIINGEIIEQNEDKLLEVLPGNNKFLLFIKIIPVCVLDCVSILLLCIMRENKNSFYELDYKALLIIVTSIFIFFFLKFKMYWHHKFGTGLILIGIAIFTGVEIVITNISDDDDFLMCLILSVLIQLCTGIQETSEKYFIDKKYVSPFMMVAFEGLIGNAIISLLFIPLSHIECGDKKTTSFLHCNPYSNPQRAIEDILESILFVLRNKQYIIYLSALFVSYLLFNVFRILTNAKCSPTHRAIADILGYFLYWVARFNSFFEPTEMHKGPFWLIGGVSYVIIIVGVFVYLELIVIHICGFKDNTDEEIMMRGQSENQIMLESMMQDDPVGHIKEDEDELNIN